MKTSRSNKLFFCAAALALGFLGQTTALAQVGGVPLWTNIYNGSANGADQARAMALDSGGSVLVTGSSAGSGSGLDYATIKYSAAGVPLWTNLWNGPGNGNDQARAVAVDASGDVFVTGSSTGTVGGFDYATIKYSATGVPLWTNRYNGLANGDDEASAMAADSSGNVFVAGSSAGSGSGLDYVTIRYSGAGVAVWTNVYNGTGNGDDEARGVAVDGGGNVFVTGRSAGINFGAPDYATIAYSGAGVPLWTNRCSPNSYSEASAVVVDRSGNVFVTGKSGGSFATVAYSGAGVSLWTNTLGGPGTAVAVAVDSSGNAFVTGDSHFHIGDSIYETKKFSGSGVELWTSYYYSSANNADYPAAIAADANGDVFVTGRSGNSGGPSDYVTVAYSGAGVQLWINRYDGPGNTDDHPAALAVDGSGNVFVTGYSTGIGSGSDYATIKYSLIPTPLIIARTTTNTIALSWPSPSAGFTLQQNTNGIATVNWSNVVTAPSDDGTTRTLIVNPPTGNAFYRLVHP